MTKIMGLVLGQNAKVLIERDLYTFLFRGKIDACQMETEDRSFRLCVVGRNPTITRHKDGGTTKKELKEQIAKLEECYLGLQMPPRAVNSLRCAGVRYIYELTDLTEENLLGVKNLGKRSLQCIIVALEDIGLKLKGKGK